MHLVKEVKYANPHHRKKRKCRVVLLHCMDYRFHRRVGRFVKKHYGRHYNLCKKGGAKWLVDESTREHTLHSIEVAVENNPIEVIVVVVHLDCAAYGGSRRFTNKDQEHRFLIDQLVLAGSIACKRFPEQKIVMICVGWKKMRVYEFSQDQ